MHDAPQVGEMPSRERNAARVQHDRTLEVTLGVESSWLRRKEDKVRYINAVTRKDVYLIPRIVDSRSKHGNAKFFNTSDLISFGNRSGRRTIWRLSWTGTSGRECPSACAVH